MILRIMSGNLTKRELSVTEGLKKMRWQSTPVTREVLAFGIRPFLHTPSDNEAKSIVAPLNKPHHMPEMGNFVRQECVEFLSAKRDDILQVESVLPAFNANDNKMHLLKVLREIKCQEGFAIIGLVVPPPGKQIDVILGMIPLSFRPFSRIQHITLCYALSCCSPSLEWLL